VQGNKVSTTILQNLMVPLQNFMVTLLQDAHLARNLPTAAKPGHPLRNRRQVQSRAR
jgi:hypothetical protein